MNRTAALLLALALAVPAARAAPLRIASWNLEWMMLPATFDALAARCTDAERRVRGGERSIPCDLVPGARWSAADLARLRDYAAAASLDVIALQEIDGLPVARRLFPQHVFCFTARRHVQNVGFAVRRGIPHRCDRDYRALGLDDEVRRGADLTLYPGTGHAIRLLAVHLKSACHGDPLDAPRDACRLLQRQVPVLEDWIDRRAAAGSAFAVIGDFNRRFEPAAQPARDARGRILALWPEVNDGEPAGAALIDAGAGHGAIACGTRYGPREPIDHFVLGRELARALVPGSFRAWNYPAGPRWPDHCLLSIELQPERLDDL